MLEYAAQDTRFLLQLRSQRESSIARRLHWAGRNSRALRARVGSRGEHGRLLPLKGARDLSRRELAVLVRCQLAQTVRRSRSRHFPRDGQ